MNMGKGGGFEHWKILIPTTWVVNFFALIHHENTETIAIVFVKLPLPGIKLAVDSPTYVDTLIAQQVYNCKQIQPNSTNKSIGE